MNPRSYRRFLTALAALTLTFTVISPAASAASVGISLNSSSSGTAPGSSFSVSGSARSLVDSPLPAAPVTALTVRTTAGMTVSSPNCSGGGGTYLCVYSTPLSSSSSTPFSFAVNTNANTAPGTQGRVTVSHALGGSASVVWNAPAATTTTAPGNQNTTTTTGGSGNPGDSTPTTTNSGNGGGGTTPTTSGGNGGGTTPTTSNGGNGGGSGNGGNGGGSGNGGNGGGGNGTDGGGDDGTTTTTDGSEGPDDGSDPDAGNPSDDGSDAELGMIAGIVFDDLNVNGVRDAAEPSDPNPMVTLRENQEPFRTIRFSNSPYRFTGIPDGSYTVSLDLDSMPEGYRPTTADFRTIIVVNGNASSVDFGVTFAPNGFGSDGLDSVPDALAFDDGLGESCSGIGCWWWMAAGLFGVTIALVGGVLYQFVRREPDYLG